MCGPSSETTAGTEKCHNGILCGYECDPFYYKCMDDWQDEHKPLRYAYARLLKSGGREHMSAYPEKTTG